MFTKRDYYQNLENPLIAHLFPKNKITSKTDDYKPDVDKNKATLFKAFELLVLIIIN